jgi:hypothetical protein
VPCRVIAAAFLCVWLVLLAGDFCEDLGFLDGDGSAVDLALDGALADLGQAIASSDHSNVVATWLAARHHSPTAPALLPALFYANRIFRLALREAHSPPERALRQRGYSAVLLL